MTFRLGQSFQVPQRLYLWGILVFMLGRFLNQIELVDRSGSFTAARAADRFTLSGTGAQTFTNETPNFPMECAPRAACPPRRLN